jgi:predicted nucleic acid-binding protein
LKFLVDANVLSEATRPSPEPHVLGWLSDHEAHLLVNPIILGELKFGILHLPEGRRTKAQVARDLGLSRETLYQYLRLP